MSNNWPKLALDDWQATCDTLHRWTQIVGKIRLTQMPWINHSWHVPLYLSARGMTTGTMPHGERIFQIDFDFIDHRLNIASSEGMSRSLALRAQSVAQFYQALMSALTELDLSVRINRYPNEVPDPVAFDEDAFHASYDPEAAQRFWRVLLQSERVFTEFRSHFCGKVSPVHFFWGSFDLAVTRFSGRPAPEHPGGVPNLPDEVAKEAYNQEVSSAGFWPGAGIGYPAYYAYAYPVPDGFGDYSVQPEAAFFSRELGEFILPYDAVRQSADPDGDLLAFLHSTFKAAADLAGWDQDALQQTWFK